MVWAKSSGTSLRSHLAVTGQVAQCLLAAVGYPARSHVLVAAAGLHDLGKARPGFQMYLEGGAWRCHEEDAPETIREFLSDQPSRRWLARVMGDDLPLPGTEEDVDDVIAFAVTHHGRRYYRLGTNGTAVRMAPVGANVASTETEFDLTEFDLLYRYRPYGGAVILADQIASALQSGCLGVLVSVDPADQPQADPAADLADESGMPPENTGDAALLPQGSGLQRLLLDGLGVGRVDATRDALGWHLAVDGKTVSLIRSEL